MCGVNDIIAGVQEIERAKEGEAVLFNDVLHSAAIDFRSVGYRILWIKFKFSKVKVCVVVGYGPNEGIGEGRGSGMTWTRLWIEYEMGIDYACWET